MYDQYYFLQRPVEKWDDSSKSKEQIKEKLLNRQVAAMRREKALAYASTHQVGNYLFYRFLYFGV